VVRQQPDVTRHVDGGQQLRSATTDLRWAHLCHACAGQQQEDNKIRTQQGLQHAPDASIVDNKAWASS
jgi:hypothetical protein